MNKVVISVIMPIYNSQKFLNLAISSILEQSYKNFELILVNDASTDNSLEIINKFKLTDSRIIVISNEKNIGAASSFNVGLKIAKGYFIAKMDSDDISLKNRFEIQIKEFLKYPKIDAFGGSIILIDHNNKNLRTVSFPSTKKMINEYLESSVPVADPTVMIKKNVLLKLEGLRSKMDPADDLDLWLRLRDSNYNISNVKEVVLKYRMHDQKLSILKEQEQFQKSIMALKLSMYRNKYNKKDDLDEINDINNLFQIKEFEEFKPTKLELLEFESKGIKGKDYNEFKKFNEDFKNVKKNHPSERLIFSKILLRLAYCLYKNKKYFSFIYYLVLSFFNSPVYFLKTGLFYIIGKKLYV